MLTSKLFTILPDYICTPDGMAVDRHGNLVLSCPNFADETLPGCIVKIDRAGKVTKWFDVPVDPQTGVCGNMGIAFDDEWNLYICDNQPWTGNPDRAEHGRILRVKADDDGNILEWNVVAYGMEHPNGIKVRGDAMYLTQSSMVKVQHETGRLVSAVYKFQLTDRDIHVTNTLADKNILETFVTLNPDCQYGVDGIEFDPDGNLYIGNFGDGAVHKLTFNPDGSVKSNTIFAQNAKELQSTDGMFMDEKGNLFIADFSANAIAMVDPTGKVTRIAESPDSDGLHGELDQPGEPILWDGKLIASCFDLVTDEGKVNTAHEMPATMCYLDYAEIVK